MPQIAPSETSEMGEAGDLMGEIKKIASSYMLHDSAEGLSVDEANTEYDELNKILKEHPEIVEALIRVSKAHIVENDDFIPNRAYKSLHYNDLYFIDLGNEAWLVLELKSDNSKKFISAEPKKKISAHDHFVKIRDYIRERDVEDLYEIKDLEPEESIYSKAQRIQEESRGKTKEALKQKE